MGTRVTRYSKSTFKSAAASTHVCDTTAITYKMIRTQPFSMRRGWAKKKKTQNQTSKQKKKKSDWILDQRHRLSSIANIYYVFQTTFEWHSRWKRNSPFQLTKEWKETQNGRGQKKLCIMRNSIVSLKKKKKQDKKKKKEHDNHLSLYILASSSLRLDSRE